MTEQHRLYTWYWKAALAADVSDELVLVRTSLGKPRWIGSAANEIAYLPELAPGDGIFHIRDDAEFERAYRARLDEFGVEHIDRKFEQLRKVNGGLPLALLCFEHKPGECHRSMFASWWLEQTGELVSEFDPKPAATDDDHSEPAQGSLL